VPPLGPQQHATLGRKHFAAYFAPRFKDILQLCDRHGVDHRTPMNQTPLIAAAAAGNVALVEALLAGGANPELTDHLGATRCTGRCSRRSATRSSPAGRFPRSTS